ncbi:MAG TPA: hypothetical protein VHT27_09070 [Solirubrobacteraceae bacterium]|nr:hypothetical protein [Solirubrobacteraceae bacterium]
MSDAEQDWRLRAELTGGPAAPAPHGILARFRGPRFVDDAQSAIPANVVLTHDGGTLFAYAADRDALDRARAPLEAALQEDGLRASVTVSHWEDDNGEWTQVEPPLDRAASGAHERAKRDAHAHATATFTVEIGKEVRSEVEETMQRWARERNLVLEVVEHPHLLRTQVAFTVSGSAHDVQEFRKGLNAEERATIRTELAIEASPL